MNRQKLWVAEKYFSTFPFKSRCATEDSLNCGRNSCLCRSQLTSRIWLVSWLAKQEAQAPDRCSQSLSGSGLQDMSHIYTIHQSILKVKERVWWGPLYNLWTVQIAVERMYLSSPEQPGDQKIMGQISIGRCHLCRTCFILMWSLKSSLTLFSKLGRQFKHVSQKSYDLGWIILCLWVSLLYLEHGAKITPEQRVLRSGDCDGLN